MARENGVTSLPSWNGTVYSVSQKQKKKNKHKIKREEGNSACNQMQWGECLNRITWEPEWREWYSVFVRQQNDKRNRSSRTVRGMASIDLLTTEQNSISKLWTAWNEQPHCSPKGDGNGYEIVDDEGKKESDSSLKQQFYWPALYKK